MRVTNISNDEIGGLEKIDDAGEGSEAIITDNINYYTNLDVYKIPPMLEVGKIRLPKAVWNVGIIAVNQRITVQQR